MTPEIDNNAEEARAKLFQKTLVVALKEHLKILELLTTRKVYDAGGMLRIPLTFGDLCLDVEAQRRSHYGYGREPRKCTGRLRVRYSVDGVNAGARVSYGRTTNRVIKKDATLTDVVTLIIAHVAERKMEIQASAAQAKKRNHDAAYARAAIDACRQAGLTLADLQDGRLTPKEDRGKGKIRSHNEYFRKVILKNRKTCPTCKEELAPGESIWSWGEYAYAKWNTVKHFCGACFEKEVRQALVAHTGDCGCKVECIFHHTQPAWFTLETPVATEAA